MNGIPLNHALLLAGALFALGMGGVIARRNLLFMLMSVEVMLNAVGLAFVAAGSRWMEPDGQVLFVFVLTLAAAEVAVGLALLLQIYHRFRGLDIDAVAEMRR